MFGVAAGAAAAATIVGLGGFWLNRPRRRTLDRRREQRLWKSGPLGRRWLETKGRLRRGPD